MVEAIITIGAKMQANWLFALAIGQLREYSIDSYFLPHISMKTSVALCAQAIRKDLKTAYPQTKFSVKSKSYSGGDSIDVSYTQTLADPREKEVRALLAKYQEGHFDGMTDMYEYNTDRGDLGTKYLFVRADIDNLKIEYKSAFMKDWGLTTDSDAECYEKLHERFDYSLCQYIRKNVLQLN